MNKLLILEYVVPGIFTEISYSIYQTPGEDLTEVRMVERYKESKRIVTISSKVFNTYDEARDYVLKTE